VAKRLRHSRRRRLPGAYRVHERAAPDPGKEPRRLSLFLPDEVLDRAEAQALRAGFETVQAYCATLLEQAIMAQHDRDRIEDAEARRGPLRGLDAIANDPDYLAEWSASAIVLERTGPAERERPERSPGPAPVGADLPRPPGAPNSSQGDPTGAAVAVVFRHAAVGAEDPAAFLPALRRGEPIGPGPAEELLQALGDLEGMLRTAPLLDRRLAYALHRLAFEGQILLTEAWPDAAANPATVDLLRVVQEAVDRVLSGEDIRYYAPGPAPGTPS
jgi:hypothetical protein